MDSNIVSLVDRTGSSKFQSPEMALREALEDIKEGGCWEASSKMLIIVVDDSTDEFKIGFANAAMKASEIIAVCEIIKTRALVSMGHIGEGNG